MRGKVNMAVLKTAFGESLMSSLAALGSNNANGTSEDMDASSSGQRKDEENAFCGSNIEPGKLQVRDLRKATLRGGNKVNSVVDALPQPMGTCDFGQERGLLNEADSRINKIPGGLLDGKTLKET